jgi:FAD:protein FMN transferase
MKYFKFFTYISLIFLFTSCIKQQQDLITINGNTMGTYFIVNIVNPPLNITKDRLKKEIEDVLINVNQKMSNWDKQSEISLLNSHKSFAPIKISDDLTSLINAANKIHKESKGFLDITLDPLIDLWGFGYNNKIKKVPSDRNIQKTLKFVNQEKLLKLDVKNKLITKLNVEVSMNLSSIAKGYGIDMIGKKLEAIGIKNFLIDIGGDILTKGLNSKNDEWIIGIENPDLKEKLIKEIVNISNKSIATSGDYKNYYIEKGIQYSHILNPKSGKPIKHSTKSVTIIHNTAMEADGWATAFLAMGSQKGLKLAEEKNIAALFIDKINNKLIKIKTTKFKNLKKVKIE